MRIPRRLAALLPCLLVPMAALAQPAEDTTVIQPENVRMDVAQVMRVQPIYQTLRATRMEEQCPQQETPVPGSSEKSMTRIVGAFRGLTRRPREAPRSASPRCKMVAVQREFRRPIAYDVDYVYRGMKYRSRLPYDPGNRLKVRVSVMPYMPPRDGTP